MNPTYLVYDIETIPDLKLFASVKYPDLTGQEALEAEAEKRRCEPEDVFLPTSYHIPVSIAALKLDADFAPIGPVKTLINEDDDGEGDIRKFWAAIEAWKPILVDFNGRGFDIPVLTKCAYELGIQVPSFFGGTQQPREDYRYRYGSKHIDLMDWLTAYGRTFAGGVDLLSRLAGGPGKTGIGGANVAEAYKEGLFEDIDKYCRNDVRETYRIFLRTRVMMGKIDSGRERSLMEQLPEE